MLYEGHRTIRQVSTEVGIGDVERETWPVDNFRHRLLYFLISSRYR
jgi:hypothetical protein